METATGGNGGGIGAGHPGTTPGTITGAVGSVMRTADVVMTVKYA